ncbi:hypothetical protein GWI33_000774 [Rhynchophorus ferrugineus]|uniref:Uncharacterized protein n=1 Tax=Rhynchophorus ferrugineus TaxID=354439 RepID=A0A834M1D4_RHYFE|nr:hypothetical protein GWI33_000774 [Rhynchophorus ferrugineus]
MQEQLVLVSWLVMVCGAVLDHSYGYGVLPPTPFHPPAVVGHELKPARAYQYIVHPLSTSGNVLAYPGPHSPPYPISYSYREDLYSKPVLTYHNPSPKPPVYIPISSKPSLTYHGYYGVPYFGLPHHFYQPRYPLPGSFIYRKDILGQPVDYIPPATLPGFSRPFWDHSLFSDHFLKSSPFMDFKNLTKTLEEFGLSRHKKDKEVAGDDGFDIKTEIEKLDNREIVKKDNEKI